MKVVVTFTTSLMVLYVFDVLSKRPEDTEAVVLTGTLELSLYSNSFDCMSLVITISWQLSQIVLNNTYHNETI